MHNYIGVDIGGTKMYLLAQCEDGSRFDKQVPTGKNATPRYIRDEIEKFACSLGCKPDAIGIAAPGLVENDTIVISDVLPNLSNVRGSDLVPDTKCYVINDVRSATVFETSGLQASDTALVVMAGTGIACGLFSEQRIVTGCQGFAGELGSCKMISREGEIQTLDELASGAAIIAKAGIPIPEILQKLENNDPGLSKIIEISSFYMGLAISNLISIFNPNHVVFGGSTITYKGYFENVKNTIVNCTMPELLSHCDIRITNHLKNIVALGAIINIEQRNSRGQ